jgi:hypothetical protein
LEKEKCMAEEEEEDGGDGMLVFAISSLISHLLCQPCGKDISSAAGFITSELFYTDDNGTYIFPTRDFHPEIEINDGEVDLEEFLSVHKK